MADLIAVIGCGNPARSDDGFGAAVVRRLAPLEDRIAYGLRRTSDSADPSLRSFRSLGQEPDSPGSARSRRSGPRLVVRDAGTDGMAVMFAARGCSSLIIVDACRSGAAPGALFELPADAVAAPHRPSLTLHDFRWDHALYAGRAMFAAEFPADVTVLLVEAASVAFGVELSPAVAAAVDKAVARIAELLAARGLPVPQGP
jgi:hydrogenase maturation protease